MEKQGNGSIINISSMNGIRVITVPQLAYATSKAGIIALTREIAIHHAGKGIRANVILPGLIRTPLVEHSFGTDQWGADDAEEMWKKRDAMTPGGKQGDAWDVAYAALYLASDEAKYVTAMSFYVDGGLTGTTNLGFRKGE